MEVNQVPQKSKKIYFVIGGIIVLFAIIILAIFEHRQKSGQQRYFGRGNGNGQGGGQENQQNNQSTGSSVVDSFSNSYGKGCQNKTVAFTNSPLAINDIRYIQPLGLMSDGHVTPVDHIYLTPKDPNAAEGSYSVVMPADGEVLAVQSMPAQYVGDKTGMTRPVEDNRLVVRFSCRYYSIFIHVHELSPTLKAAIGTLKPGESSKPISVPVKAGELLAKLGTNPFDWTMVDTQTTLAGFISPALYDGEPWKIHSISPFDIYTGPLKTQLEALSLRSTPPVGGKIDNDIKGALIGNWFKVGSGGYASNNQESSARYYDGHLAIAPDYIDPTSTIVSIGNWEGTAKQFLVKGKVDPATVTAQSGPTKYELLNSNSYMMGNNKPWDSTIAPVKPITLNQNGDVQGTIMFQIQAGEKLKVEIFPGKKSNDVGDFTAAAMMYER